MAGVTEIRFSASKSMGLRMSKLQRILEVQGDSELMRLTGLSMYHLSSCVRHGGSIVLREEGVQPRKFMLLIREDGE